MFQSVTSLLPMITRIIVILAIFILFDTYAFQAIRTLTAGLLPGSRKIAHLSYWIVSAVFYALFVLTITGQFANANKTFLVFITGLFFALILAKILMVIPLLAEDLYRILNKIYTLIFGTKAEAGGDPKFFISRKKFISQVSAGMGGLAVTGLGYGIMRGAHDYKLHRVNIPLKNLPASFDGLRIGHISDIHSGSFWNKLAVERGVKLLMKQKPDIIFFTGDLVNNTADEMNEHYIEIFSKLKAPLGVYSCLGNHDYGDYYEWPDKHTSRPFENTNSSKSHMSPLQAANLDRLIEVHKQLGWDLLMNENRILTKGDDRIAILGIENFGAKGRFPKYGKMSEAYKGVEEIPTKLLLSHDPSHWEYEVQKKYKDINIMFSGHTHGAQFGIETANFRWSPVKYMYKQWAGLYQQDEQYLYVNRGFGYLGYPGRLGIRPELSVITLNKI